MGPHAGLAQFHLTGNDNAGAFMRDNGFDTAVDGHVLPMATAAAARRICFSRASGRYAVYSVGRRLDAPRIVISRRRIRL